MNEIVTNLYDAKNYLEDNKLPAKWISAMDTAILLAEHCGQIHVTVDSGIRDVELCTQGFEVEED